MYEAFLDFHKIIRESSVDDDRNASIKYTCKECSHDLNYLSCYLLIGLFALNDADKVPTTYREERIRSKLKNHVHLNVKEGTGLYQESFSFTRILLNV